MRQNIVYLNGRFLPYSKATIPISTHALHYGTGCFEGIRAYWNEDQKKLYIFRLKDHYQRLQRSCQTLLMKLPSSPQKLCSITRELLSKNKYRQNVYIRPLVYKSEEVITKFNLNHLSDGFAIYTVPLGHYLNVSGGISVITSSWCRVHTRTIPPSAKPTGIYLNTCLAKTEAEKAGADEAILLNLDGSVSEGSAENIFIVKDNMLYTPSVDQNILEGITRSTIIEMAEKELGLKTRQTKIDLSFLTNAQEIFLTGTGAEVTPVTRLNGKKVGTGEIGSTTSRLQKLYFNDVYGNNSKYKKWLTIV